MSEQILYSEADLNAHLKKGEYSQDGELILYHPYCDFCRMRFYDPDSFRVHLRMSSHLKCDLCSDNYPQFKYVYYKDYDEIERHFKKSHFLCEVGPCVAKKFENVFISEEALEEHKERAHHKARGRHAPVTNLLLFRPDQEPEIEWDKVGKDFEREFTMIQKNIQLATEEHKDQPIDIREFYPKLGNKLSLREIENKLREILYRDDHKNESVSINAIQFFCPLDMPSLSRQELEKFLHNVFEPKLADQIVSLFFTRKNEYRTAADYLNDVKRKMWGFSPIAYYYAFPQLARFMKDENPNKALMDQIYSHSLRALSVNRQFTFHKKEYYSDLLMLMQDKIHEHLYDSLLENKLDLQLYKSYLTTMSIQFYQNHHDKLFFVQKEKIVNLHHMVEKTKMRDLLKLSWLLKVGFSLQAQTAINDHFYYQDVASCGAAIAKLTYQELALLYAYVRICLESICDKKMFKIHKANSHPLFLTSALPHLQKCVSDKERTEL